MELFGIRFAPFNVPLQRRLQTCAAAAWMITMTFGGFVALFMTFYFALFTNIWWLVVAYLLWVYLIDKDTPETGGRPNKWVRSWIWWKYMRDYFPLYFEKLPFVELDPKKNYLFCSFPHGMLSTGTFYAFATEYSDFKSYFPHHEPRIVTLNQHYVMPLFRELALSLGGISASAKSINSTLSKPGGGHVCVLMVGGAAEAYYCKPGCYNVVLKKRKGFIKLALKNGTPLVPVLSFGETDLFDQLEGERLRNIQEKLRKFIGLAPILPIGRGFFQYSFGIIPRRRKVTTVVGKPIDIPKIENPSSEEIEKYHQIFIDALQNMFEQQKGNYLENPEDKKMVIC